MFRPSVIHALCELCGRAGDLRKKAMQACVLSVSLEYVMNSATRSCDWIIVSF